jgi:hypothetical protein
MEEKKSLPTVHGGDRALGTLVHGDPTTERTSINATANDQTPKGPLSGLEGKKKLKVESKKKSNAKDTNVKDNM